MTQLNRRQFLGAVAGAVATSSLFAAEGEKKRVRLGVIGVGWYGMVDARAALKAGGAEIVAICDVDSAHLKKNADALEKDQGKRPREFKLYEEMLKQAEMDAVIIASPPQWHALQFIAALERGLDVYCEKPLAYDVREGRAMVDAAKKSGRIVQIGFQRRKAGAIEQVRKYIQDGNAGAIIHAAAQIHYQANPADPTPVAPPPTLDWDLWCGPAPKIPYSAQVGHMNWRLEKTTGHGHLVDWGVHLIDATRFILGETMPRSVQASGGLLVHKDKITTPDFMNVTFHFERCPVLWQHRMWGAAEYSPETSNGIFFYGEKETIFVTDNKWVVVPRGKGAQRREIDARSDAGTLTMAEFLDAVRTRQQPGVSTEEAHYSTATTKLAMIAYDTGATIRWDPKTEQIIDNPEAAKLLKREYRSPWVHPYRG